MKLLAQDVKTQSWQRAAPDGGTYESTNIISRFYTAPRRIVLATHYGSSPPVPAGDADSQEVNDGSGAGLFIELARSFADLNVPPAVGIDIVFLDGAGTKKEDGGPVY